MLAHRLRHRVHIQEQVETQDPNTGAITKAWETVYLDSDTPLDSVPAEVLSGPGREFNNSGQIQAEVAARINLRWFPGLTQDMRIIWDGKTFDIGSIETDRTGRKEYRLRCTAGVNQG
ncbi:MAG: phage head closure protein [Pusillimonas sp.]|nr:phage head closure protein [Pusillimonas sp.]